MSRLSTHFLEEENDEDEPPASSSQRPGTAAVERHDIFTHDEDGVLNPQDSECVPPDTESNIGRITQIRENVEELNIHFTQSLPGFGRSSYPIEEEDTEPKEIAVLQSIDADDLAEDICICLIARSFNSLSCRRHRRSASS